MDFENTFRDNSIKMKECVALARQELVTLSEKFGQIERRVDGTLISNDEGFEELIPELQKIFEQKKQSGIGFFVGSGGVASLLPELPIDVPLVVDKNKAVIELSDLLNRLISKEDTPEAVLIKINSPEIREKYQIIRDIFSEFGNLDLIKGSLKKEARQYGQFHWTNPQRFPVVQNALRERPLVHIAADITNPGFATALKSISDENDQPITFANFTNVHSWLKPRTMDFLRDYPIETNAPFVFSSHKDLLMGSWPKVKIVDTVEQYIQEAISDK